MSKDLASKCRTCLRESSSYHQLFDYVEENYKILEMLDCIVPQIDVKTTSQLSSLVCPICVEKLLIAYKFQQLCIETNNRIHDILGIVVFESQPKLEKVLDPLNAETNIKLKEEAEDAHFESETLAEFLDEGTKSGNERILDSGSGSDSDSSNEKLSVLKERSEQKLHSKEGNFQRLPTKLKGRRTFFPCAGCGNIFTSINRLKQHTAIHDKKQAFLCQTCNSSLKSEKNLNAHMLTHGEMPSEYMMQNNSIENDFKSISQNASIDELIAKEDEDVQGKNSKENVNFQCPDCPKFFEKKASFSAHYKVHKKRELPKSKNQISEPDVEDIKAFDLANILEGNTNDIEKNSIAVVKEEIEIMPRMFHTSDNWFNNDYDNSDCASEEEIDSKPGAREFKNIDFVDTGIGEVEKPNTSNKRNGNFPCDVCGKIFDRPYRLKRHSSVHSLARPHGCEICKYRFATANILKAHLFQHSNDTGGNFHSQTRPEGFKCPDCPRRFEKQASLSAHRQSHIRNNSETNYPCTVCQRSFMSIRSLTEHITNKHPEVEKHNCDQCDKKFVLHAHLVEHLNRHKGNRNLVCLICEKEFGYNNTLKEHMRTHSGESPYLCPQCGKTFRSASNLRQHMERHTGLKKYQCPECPSRFNCRSDLIKHKSTHTNAKPHVCDICGSRFTRAYSLQKHKLLHSGERPFKCDQCSMTFVLIYHLRRHMRTHTGEKPYKCKYCERAYAESGDLTKHLRTHVGENTYMCDQCPMAFKYQAELRQHQSQHYKMAQKLLQQAQKISDGTQNDINGQKQQELDQRNLQQQQIQMPLQEQRQLEQHLKSAQIQQFPVGISSYQQQIPLIEHTPQLAATADQTQQHTKPQQQENLNIKNLSMM